MPALQIGSVKADMPIVQGGMGVGISLSGLASAVANAFGRNPSRFRAVAHDPAPESPSFPVSWIKIEEINILRILIFKFYTS